jgi:hypothetical protein
MPGLRKTWIKALVAVGAAVACEAGTAQATWWWA